MAKSIPALINKDMLVWARIQAGYNTIKEVSTKTRFPENNLRLWESGEKKPSLRQAEKLAKTYHCSYSILSLKEPPTITPIAKEYRRLPGVKPGNESPSLRFALRDLMFRRRIALNLVKELGDVQQSFSQSCKLIDDPEFIAKQIRELLNITQQKQFAWKSNSEAWKGWRNSIETLGVLVFVFNDVDAEEIRGVSLFHKILPVIGINSKEKPASRPFTLLHELVHIMLANGNEERPAMDETKSKLEWTTLERFAERVTGAVLIPKDLVIQEPLVMSHSLSSSWTLKEILRLANRFKVTPLAFATRLLVLGLMSPLDYGKWKLSWKAFLENNPPKESGGFATPAQKALNRNGNILTSLVIDALSIDRISPVHASQYLKVSYQYVEELRMFFAFGRPLVSTSSEG